MMRRFVIGFVAFLFGAYVLLASHVMGQGGAGQGVFLPLVLSDGQAGDPEGPPTSTPTATALPTPVPATADYVARVIQRTNMYRQAEGCPALTFNQQLTNAAQGHAADMALNDFFGHQGSDGSSPWDRMARAGYRQAGAAENVAAGYPTPEEVVDGWMTSPGHRQNILNCDYRDIGIGYYYLDDDTGTHNYHSYWVQKFGTPAP